VDEYKCGSRARKSTVDHVLTLIQRIEKHYVYNKPFHLLSIDFKQIYDSIKRKSHWKSIEKLSIQTKLVRILKAYIEILRCKIKFRYYYSEEFEAKIGLKQRDALSPMLFNIALKKVVRKVQEITNGAFNMHY